MLAFVDTLQSCVSGGKSRKQYQKEIDEAREEVAQERERAKKGSVRKQSGVCKFPDFTGKQVIVPSEYFSLFAG